MEIFTSKNSGFCAGVKYTIIKAEEALENSDSNIDCLGELIHNKQVIDDLKSKGLKIIDSIQDASKKVIIRAHGTSKEVYEYALTNNIELIDLTCPNVLKIHNQVQEFAKKNYFIFLLGIKNHPETIATFSFCGDNSYLIENENDILPAIKALKKSNLTNIFIISQTTFSLALFEKIISVIKQELDEEYNIEIEKSICNATSMRQKDADDISSKVDLMIIVGGKNSSNTKKLYEVSSKNCKNTIHVETKDELDINFLKQFKKVGIMAGASTPDYITDEIISLCKTI